MDFFGAGYETEEQAAAAKRSAQPPLRIHSTINGPEPGYILCSIACVQAALTLLDEHDAHQVLR